MTHDDTHPDWSAEQLPAYLAGGLTAAERLRLEQLADASSVRRAELEEMMTLDASLSRAAGVATIMVGLEDRLAAALPRRRWLIAPAVRRALLATAACAALGMVGYLESQPTAVDRLWGWNTADRISRESNLSQIGRPLNLYANENVGLFPRTKWTSPSGTASADAMTAKDAEITQSEILRDPKDWPDLSSTRDKPVTIQRETERKSFPISDDLSATAKKQESFKPGDLSLADRVAGPSGPQTYTGGTLVMGGTLQPALPAVTNQLGVAEGKNIVAASGDLAKQAQNGPVDQPAAPATAALDTRKIIRTGEMEFEVDRFDSAAAVVSKIVDEQGGFVATTNSDKLDNGKVRGAVVLRMPPGNLDSLVLQLRALGDLKSQRIGSADVTKEYTDFDSELRADRAMETRLLDLIKNGRGEIKDLLAAEKELAEWRGKIEKIVGQMKYYDNQVALSTLTITLTERDIHTPAATVEQETISAGIEADDVEKARTAALQILADAKARIVSADLKKLDAGQMASTIVADIPPDGSGPVIDRIKLLGKVARLEAAQSQTADPNAPATASTKIDRRDSRLTLSLYNVANVAPRQSTNVNLAVSDVAAAYARIAAEAVKAGGRVVSGGATQQATADASRANASLEIPADAADAFLLELGQVGQVVSSATTENPDTSNVTTSKRGFAVSIFPSAALPPVQSASLRVETGDVEQSSASVTAAILAAGGRVISSSTDANPAGVSTANLAVEVPLDKNADAINLVRGAGKVLAATSQQNSGAPAGSLARARLDITFTTASPIAGETGGLIDNLRNGFALSAKGLLYSLQMVVIGLCFVLPWALVLWAAVKLWKRRRSRAAVV